MKNYAWVLVGVMIVCTVSGAGAEEVDVAFDTPEGWRSETMRLPLPFAPQMKFRGLDELRFSPGMFKAEKDDFFTYVFVMSLDPDQPLTEKVIQKELTVYYQGLAQAVGKATAAEVAKFTLAMTKSDEVSQAPAAAVKPVQYSGLLTWTEPFVTRKSQKLHLEVQSFGLSDSDRSYLFVCASPQRPAHSLWKKMRSFRETLRVKSQVEEQSERETAVEEDESATAPAP